jgi:enoyl-[acyl-carrier protein] reductase/trans-2-enoyl-CoA reductase (NAD+)
MVIQPKIRNNTCLTSHPLGCKLNVKRQIEAVKRADVPSMFKNVLIIGASTGYGLAARITAAFSGRAATLGVSYEKEENERSCGTSGWYNTRAFEEYAAGENLPAFSINGDAFQDSTKEQALTLITRSMGKVDLVVYSLAAPRRTDPVTGETYFSSIKPIGRDVETRTLDFLNSKILTRQVEAAAPSEISHTVKVMGGEDWELWINALQRAGLLAWGAQTVAFSYLGPELTHAFYRHGTLGKAKEHLEATAKKLNAGLAVHGGRAFTSVNKAVVTRASAVIPGVPLYMAILYKIMKRKHIHEGCIEQMIRLFRDYLCVPEPRLDEEGRIRLDDLELRTDVQAEVNRVWPMVTSKNLSRLADVEGFRDEFYKFFGFNFPEVDYSHNIDLRFRYN